MKLRLNCGLQDLAYRLQVPLSTMAQRYQEMISMLYVRLNFLILWPKCEILRKTMPFALAQCMALKL